MHYPFLQALHEWDSTQAFAFSFSDAVGMRTNWDMNPGRRIAVMTRRVTRMTVPFPTPAQFATFWMLEAFPECPKRKRTMASWSSMGIWALFESLAKTGS
jgi:hypothetical protein